MYDPVGSKVGLPGGFEQSKESRGAVGSRFQRRREDLAIQGLSPEQAGGRAQLGPVESSMASGAGYSLSWFFALCGG